MLWTIFAQLYSTLLELLRLSHISADEKDFEIPILHQQLDMTVNCQNILDRSSIYIVETEPPATKSYFPYMMVIG